MLRMRTFKKTFRTYGIGFMENFLIQRSQAEFELPGAKGHWCFVFEPLTIDLNATRAIIHFGETVFKTIAFHVFRALEFLHTKAKMVHGCASLPRDFSNLV